MSIFNKIFRKGNNKKPYSQGDVKKKLPTLKEFTELDADERISAIIFIGDSGKLEYFPLIKYAILEDTNQNVKFAALKRIHLFKENVEVVSMLTDIKMSGDGKNFEPYFSMALYRLGILTKQEFESIIDSAL